MIEMWTTHFTTKKKLNNISFLLGKIELKKLVRI